MVYYSSSKDLRKHIACLVKDGWKLRAPQSRTDFITENSGIVARMQMRRDKRWMADRVWRRRTPITFVF
ncbi:hypothetical protein [Trinickia sp.]|uniref:hypothetical protein n=1 Tax=Trinickia sp. TaxID=2571163 RepID=UPI003F7F54CB